MPGYHEDSPREQPTKRSRSRSASSRGLYKSDRSPRRRSYHESASKGNRRNGRDDLRSPPRRRHRSRSPEDDGRRRMKGDGSSGNASSGPQSRRDSRDRRKCSHRYRSDSRSPPPKSHRHNSRERDRDRGKDKDYDRDRKPSHHSRDAPQSPNLAPAKRSKAPLPSQQAAFTNTSNAPEGAVTKPDADKLEKQKPNYAPSGLLAAETNTVANTGIVLKYNEPPESRLPPASQPWRLYVFKNKDLLDTIPLHTRPCWLFGREKAVCDVPVEHPSASKQHAVLQFRYVEKAVGDFGEKKGVVALYLLDLESANGTRLNGEGLPGRRFVECKSGDVVQFGESIREYVVLLPPKD